MSRYAIRERILPNGIRILGVQDPESHSMALRGFLRGSALLDPAGKEGLAVLAGQMLDQGTARRSRRQLALLLDRMGATLRMGGTPESTDISARCLPPDLPTVLAVARDCLGGPSAPQDELDKIRQQILTSLKSDRDSTRWVARYTAMQALYGGQHPYGRDHRGTPDSLAAVTRQDVLQYADRAYGPNALTLTWVGPQAFDVVCRSIEKAFQGWRTLEGFKAADIPAAHQPVQPGEQRITMAGKSQSDLIVTQLAIARTHADYHALQVAINILGQFGLMGRIGERVRDTLGLAYYAFASLDARIGAGHWAVAAGVNPANLRQALDAIGEEIRRIGAELVLPAELEDSRSSLLGSLPVTLETHHALCNQLRAIAYYDLPLDYLDRYQAAIGTVTRERILELAQTYLVRPEPVVVIAGP